jgi:hypothetical protein
MTRLKQLRERFQHICDHEGNLVFPSTILALIDLVEAQHEALVGYDPRTRLGAPNLSQADLMAVDALALYDEFNKGETNGSTES